MGVSLKPSEAASGGGGPIDDVDARITKCRFRLWDYNGTITTPVLGLEVTFVEDDGAETAQVYSAGDTKHFVPSPDGSEAVRVGDREALSDSTNAMAFMVSLVNSGFPEERITDKCSVFEGTKVHVNKVPQPKRKGKGVATGGEPKDIVLVTKILEYPWDKAAGPAKAAPKAAPKTSAPTAAPGMAAAVAPAVAGALASAGNGAAFDHPLNGKATEALFGIVLAKGGSVAKAALAQEAFKALAADPDRNALVQLIYSDAFLGQAGVPWAFDGTTVSMAS